MFGYRTKPLTPDSSPAENLKQLPQAFIGPDKGPGIYISASNDNYDASRLLLRELVEQFDISGNPIAIVPTRDSEALLVWLSLFSL